ncbi:MAG: hypothetical protein IK042_02185 [Bacteroidales bacterium]|nr:hypothetical protein [Bacteroidales bacterium]
MNQIWQKRKSVKEAVTQLLIWGFITLSFLSLPKYLSAYSGNGRAYLGPFTLTIQTENTVKEYLENADAESGRIIEIRQQNGGSTTTSYTTLFLVKDHLGSVRAVTDSL